MVSANPYGKNAVYNPGRGLGGGQSPGHISRNAYYSPADPSNSYRDANGRIVYTAPKSKSKAKAAPDPYLGLMEKAMGAITGDGGKGAGNPMQNKLLDMLGGGGAAPKKLTGREQRLQQRNMQFSQQQGQGGQSQIPNYIGQHQQQPDIQQFLPSWLTDQTQNDIYAKGGVRGAMQTNMTQTAGARGLDYGSPMFAANAVRNHAQQTSQAGRAGAEAGFQDHLERAKFDIRHALAGNQDVLQGAQNQAMRDAMSTQGNSQYFNQILSMLQGLV